MSRRNRPLSNVLGNEEEVPPVASRYSVIDDSSRRRIGKLTSSLNKTTMVSSGVQW